MSQDTQRDMTIAFLLNRGSPSATIPSHTRQTAIPASQGEISAPGYEGSSPIQYESPILQPATHIPSIFFENMTHRADELDTAPSFLPSRTNTAVTLAQSGNPLSETESVDDYVLRLQMRKKPCRTLIIVPIRPSALTSDGVEVDREHVLGPYTMSAYDAMTTERQMKEILDKYETPTLKGGSHPLDPIEVNIAHHRSDGLPPYHGRARLQAPTDVLQNLVETCEAKAAAFAA